MTIHISAVLRMVTSSTPSVFTPTFWSVSVFRVSNAMRGESAFIIQMIRLNEFVLFLNTNLLVYKVGLRHMVEGAMCLKFSTFVM